MRYLLIVLAILVLVGCNRENATIIDNGEIKAIETEESDSRTEIQIVYLPTILSGNKYCTENDILELFKNTVAAKNKNINFADGKLRYINLYKLMAFTSKFEEYKKRHGFGVWRKKFDCDEFAQMFMIFLKMEFLSYDIQEEMEKASRMIHEINNEDYFDKLIGGVFDSQNEPEGIAVGEVWFSQKVEGSDYPSNHAINIVFLGPDNFIFIEPQDSSILHLSEEEINSIYFIRF